MFNRWNYKREFVRLFLPWLDAAVAKARIEQLEAQLAACGAAALNGSKDVEVPRGSFGWSPAYDEVLQLRRKYEHVLQKPQMGHVPHAVNTLNRLLRADSEAMVNLFFYWVRVNKEALIKDPTAQCVEEAPDFWKIGVLGVINALFGVNADGRGYITAVTADNDGRVIRFERTRDK